MVKFDSNTKSKQLVNTSAHVTVGVLGHVDHGKSSLVKALTGTDTDRLKEEKKRGLSIVLGYAHLKSEIGVIDFIDVPGHEDFIRMMISGATGIDYVLLTVAANEGIKPQTEEHFNIAKLLGIKNGLAIVTKSDLVSRQQCENIKQEIVDFTKGTFLESTPIMETSISDENSIDSLRTVLEKLLVNPIERKITGKCFLPFDRVFTMPGFGTVATGTLRNGELVNGQKVEIMPNGLQVSIRQMQVHKESVKLARPGQRVAVNLRNINRQDINRGDALVAEGYLQATRLLDAELQILEGIERIPKYAEVIRLLFGTCEVLAIMRLLGTNKQLKPGSTCVVQLSCLRDVVIPIGERIIIRTMSPVTTIAGGRILDNSPVKHRRSDQTVINRLQNLASDNKTDVIYEIIQSADCLGIDMDELFTTTDGTLYELDQLFGEGKIILIKPQHLISKKTFDDLCKETLEKIKKYHNGNPSRLGQPLSEFRSRLSIKLDDIVFKFLIEHLNVQKLIQTDKSIIRLSKFNPLQTLNKKEQKITEDILKVFKSGGLKPPELDEVLQRDSQRERLYHLLKESGELVPINNRDIKRTIVFHRAAITNMVSKLEQVYRDSQTFTVADVRKLVDTSRKFAIPLLEYLDSKRVTIRVGDKRKLFGNKNMQ